MADRIIELQWATEDSALQGILTQERCKAWLTEALQPALAETDIEITLRIVDKDESQQLNRDYRGMDKPTNVLSFEFDMSFELDVDEPQYLGDLVVCAPVVAQEAKDQGKSLEAHWAHMIVHGCLHLQGFDHINDHEAEQMEALELQIMQRLGFDNPYND